MRAVLLAALLCVVTSAACVPSGSNAEFDERLCSPASAPSRLRPQQIAEHVRALVEVNCIEQAQVWYLRGSVRAGVENALVPEERAFEAYGILLQNAGAQSLRHIDPAAIPALLEDAIRWEAAAPLEYPSHPNPAAVTEARSNVAAFLRESVRHTQARAAAVSAVESQIAGGVPDESRAIVGEAARSVLAPLASVRISGDCHDRIRFAAPFTHAPAASADGRIAAIETCHDYRIIDTQSGATIQSVARTDYYPVIVRAAETTLQVILAPTRQNSSGAATILYAMSPTESVHPLTLPWPQGDRERPNIRRSAGSADGDVVVLELGIGSNEGSRYVAYDLRHQLKLWEGPDVDSERTRLMWRVERRDGDYTLISEVRRNRFDIEGGELLNLRTGRQEFVQYAALPVNYVHESLPTCDLRETSERGQAREFGRFLILATGRVRLRLIDPPRAPISDCTVAANGTQLLVAVPPFIHRFTIERRAP